jgi:hypothetical protein
MVWRLSQARRIDVRGTPGRTTRNYTNQEDDGTDVSPENDGSSKLE